MTRRVGPADRNEKEQRMVSRVNQRTGGQIFVDCLRLHGVDTVFCVPGESYLAVLDALYDVADEIRVVVCRQEGGAANIAT